MKNSYNRYKELKLNLGISLMLKGFLVFKDFIQK